MSKCPLSSGIDAGVKACSRVPPCTDRFCSTAASCKCPWAVGPSPWGTSYRAHVPTSAGTLLVPAPAGPRHGLRPPLAGAGALSLVDWSRSHLAIFSRCHRSASFAAAYGVGAAWVAEQQAPCCWLQAQACGKGKCLLKCSLGSWRKNEPLQFNCREIHLFWVFNEVCFYERAPCCCALL